MHVLIVQRFSRNKLKYVVLVGRYESNYFINTCEFVNTLQI